MSEVLNHHQSHLKSTLVSSSLTTASCNKLLVSHTWKIEGFTSLPRVLGHGIFTRFTLTNSAFNSTWELSLYPMGKTEDVKTYVSLFMGMISSERPAVQLMFDFRIIHPTIESKTKIFQDPNPIAPKDFTQSIVIGFPKACHYSTLVDSQNGYLGPNDSLLLRVNLAIYYDSKINEISNTINSHTNKAMVLLDYANLLKQGTNSDLIVAVEGKEIPAHKSILSARSHVFKSMFSSEMKENKEDRLEIKQYSENVVQLILEHIYIGQLRSKVSSWEDGINLFKAADQYGLDHLVEEAPFFLSPFLTVENVLAAYQLGRRYFESSKGTGQSNGTFIGAQNLIKVCRSFMLLHFDKVVDSNPFQKALDYISHDESNSNNNNLSNMSNNNNSLVPSSMSSFSFDLNGFLISTSKPYRALPTTSNNNITPTNMMNTVTTTISSTSNNSSSHSPSSSLTNTNHTGSTGSESTSLSPQSSSACSISSSVSNSSSSHQDNQDNNSDNATTTSLSNYSNSNNNSSSNRDRLISDGPNTPPLSSSSHSSSSSSSSNSSVNPPSKSKKPKRKSNSKFDSSSRYILRKRKAIAS